ncbi:MAG: GNVR domain-containing protein [Ignavibacteria bacterium]
MSEKTEDKGSGLRLIDYLNVFFRYRKFILSFTLTLTAITIFVVFFVMDPIFYSYATVKTTSKSGDISSLIGGAGLTGMDFGELAGGGSVYKELALYDNILNSRRSLEELIVKFNIIEEEKFKYMYDALKYVRENVIELKKDKIAGTMEIGAYDKDPKRAKEMVEYLVNSLNKINIELNVLNAKNNREFIETRYNLAKEDLKKSEDSLKAFQDVFGVAPDAQIKAAAQIGVQLEVEIKSEEVKLEIMKKILAPDQPEVKQQVEKVNLLKAQLSKMKNESSTEDMLALKGKPDVAINYLRLVRNIEIQSKIVTFLLPMYEQSKIEENRETPSVLILDYPFEPDKKVKPKRLTITVVVFLLALLSSAGISVLSEKWKIYRNHLVSK